MSFSVVFSGRCINYPPNAINRLRLNVIGRHMVREIGGRLLKDYGGEADVKFVLMYVYYIYIPDVPPNHPIFSL